MDPSTEEAIKENDTWRKERLERCKDPNGWLTLAGLCWLEEGLNTFGGASDNKVVFEVPSAPPRLGTVILNAVNDPAKAVFYPITGVEVFHQGEVVNEPLDLLHDEQPGGPTILTYGRYAFRLKDSESPVLKNFTGIDMYPVEVRMRLDMRDVKKVVGVSEKKVDLKWRFNADYVPYDPPKTFKCPNALGEMEEQMSPGYVRFTVDGQEYKLDVTVLLTAITKGNPEVKAFIIFADATTNKTTYGGGRYLYSSGPVKDGKIIIDFNQAYNPPCVFTDFATCTYAHPDNRLTTLAIEAGEKKYQGGSH